MKPGAKIVKIYCTTKKKGDFCMETTKKAYLIDIFTKRDAFKGTWRQVFATKELARAYIKEYLDEEHFKYVVYATNFWS